MQYFSNDRRHGPWWRLHHFVSSAAHAQNEFQYQNTCQQTISDRVVGHLAVNDRWPPRFRHVVREPLVVEDCFWLLVPIVIDSGDDNR